VYEFPTIRAYIDAIYLRGVKMLHALRQNLGDDAFFDWLRRYADAGAGHIVTPEQFWSLLTPEQWDATALTRQEYLRQPQMVVIESP
jgi:aminopeptidase N